MVERSNKWTFLIYQESAPSDYLNILEELHVPFILSPWHNRDVTVDGELKKSHKHGALFFDSLKSYSQVSNLISQKLNGPTHVEIVMSPKGMYDYFTHAENPEKTMYNIEDIESGAGFELKQFLIEQAPESFLADTIDLIEQHGFVEFEQLVTYARKNNAILLQLLVNKTYFFSKLLDSRRWRDSSLKHNKKGGEDDYNC